MGSSSTALVRSCPRRVHGLLLGAGLLCLGPPGCRDDGAGADMSTTDAMDDGEGGSVDSGGVPGDANAGAPVLHRLTQVQINNSLRALFDAPNLAGVSLPPDFEVHGFSNNASVRTATPYLVESLQRDFQRVTGVLMAEPGAWLACSATGGDDPLGCGHTTLANVAPQIFRRPLTTNKTQ